MNKKPYSHKKILNNGRACLVTYTIWDWPIEYWNIWAIGGQELEWLNLMLAQRKFLAWMNWVKEEEVNILSYVDLFGSWWKDLAYLKDSLEQKP